ncbi:MAG: leucine-rich repeat domain-containing protein [Clostridiales bacterium]|nr:leucine-rich repeat domain-containing protein [Clostridiales bacterium]
MKRLSWLLCLLLSVGLSFSPGLAQTQKVLGKPVDTTVTALTFEKLTPRDAYRMAEEIAALPDLQTVTIYHPHMSVRQLIKLRGLAPQVHFVFNIRWNTREINTDDAYLDLGMRHGIACSDLMELLELMPNVNEVSMYGMHIPIRDLDLLMAAYPEVVFHKLVSVSDTFYRDDITALSTRHSTSSKRDNSEHFAQSLVYLPNLLALDLGHNSVTELDFLTLYPTLKVLILADNRITDLSRLAELGDLEYLELFMNHIADLAPLSGLAKLKDLNLAHNEIADLTPLYSLTQLERLWISVNPVTAEQIDALRAALPDTEIVTGENWSTGAGWREHPRYDTVRTLFDTEQYIPFTE